jgi:hypothetical protein
MLLYPLAGCDTAASGSRRLAGKPRKPVTPGPAPGVVLILAARRLA